MAKTFLYDEHVKLNARMVDFAGWDMPVQYKSIIEEHNNVRNNVGLFDVSHMGEIFVNGKDALVYLQTLVPQDISKIVDKKAKLVWNFDADKKYFSHQYGSFNLYGDYKLINFGWTLNDEYRVRAGATLSESEKNTDNTYAKIYECRVSCLK